MCDLKPRFQNSYHCCVIEHVLVHLHWLQKMFSISRNSVDLCIEALSSPLQIKSEHERVLVADLPADVGTHNAGFYNLNLPGVMLMIGKIP